MAFWALGLIFAIDKSLELVMAFLADVFVNGHTQLRIQCLLKSIRGEFAN